MEKNPIANRFGIGPKHDELRELIVEFAQKVDAIVPDGNFKNQAFRHLDLFSDQMHATLGKVNDPDETHFEGEITPVETVDNPDRYYFDDENSRWIDRETGSTLPFGNIHGPKVVGPSLDDSSTPEWMFKEGKNVEPKPIKVDPANYQPSINADPDISDVPGWGEEDDGGPGV